MKIYDIKIGNIVPNTNICIAREVRNLIQIALISYLREIGRYEIWPHKSQPIKQKEVINQ